MNGERTASVSRTTWLLGALALLALGPGIWFVHLSVTYFLIPVSCRAGTDLPLYGVTVVALVAAGVVAYLAMRSANRLGRASPRDWMRAGVAESPREDDRYTLTTMAMVLAVYFLLIVAVAGLIPVVVDRCA